MFASTKLASFLSLSPSVLGILWCSFVVFLFVLSSVVMCSHPPRSQMSEEAKKETTIPDVPDVITQVSFLSGSLL